jgi:hypothetical protein
MDLLVRTSGGWAAAEPVGYRAEAEFQALVRETFDPTLVSQDDIPVVVAREVPTPAGGRIDVVAVDQEGAISLCECKLDRNAGSRREVLGQVIEYGASLNGMTFDEFRRLLAIRLGIDPVEAMRDRASDDFDPVAWGEAVSRTLADGRFRLIVAVDQLTDALKQTVLYLNERASFSLVVAELRRIEHGGVDVLAPSLFGEEAAQRKLPRRRVAQTVSDSDTVVVAARRAYPEFEELGAYVCQPERSFRKGTEYLGFYAGRTIYPEFPKIVERRKNLLFSAAEVSALRNGGDRDRLLAAVMEGALSGVAQREEGARHQIVLLDRDQGFTLESPIRHDGPGAWTQGQRYTRSGALRSGVANTDELAAAEG